MAVAATVGGVLSQYVIPDSWVPPGIAGLVFGLFLAYGIGFIAFFLAFGVRPLRNFVRRNGPGAREAFRWYGIFTLVGLLLAILLIMAFTVIEPHRLATLEQKETPVIQAGASNPLFYIILSVIVVGFAEETIFRGYILGTLLTLNGTKNWRVHAIWTSVLFASVHLYYYQTYDEVSLIYYAQIVTLGVAFAYAYVLSGGNILFIALLHGGFDAVSFLSLAAGGQDWSAALHYVIILLAAIWALYLYTYHKQERDEWDGHPEVTAEHWPPQPIPQVTPWS